MGMGSVPDLTLKLVLHACAQTPPFVAALIK